jgi:phenylacetate-coenzyme A ligase PaaK-like adenylate-forming protein
LETFESFERLIYTVNEGNFEEIALRLFHFQASHNKVYAEYLDNLGIDLRHIKSTDRIPFIPITFFKSRDVRTGYWEEDVVFTSSGTTGSNTSRHPARRAFYLQNAVRCFRHFFGPPEDYVFLALLPGYLDRTGSSLIEMVAHFIAMGKNSGGFFTRGDDELLRALNKMRQPDKPAILWGVTHALLSLAEKETLILENTIVIETGGMKGMKSEITRDELQSRLRAQFGVVRIASEYGMTELMSQAYAEKDGVFAGPPWMKIAIRDPEDPLGRLPKGRTGGINVIDLANIYSCAFVETQDLGRTVENDRFEVLGRLDNSDIRGCNLLGQTA